MVQNVNPFLQPANCCHQMTNGQMVTVPTEYRNANGWWFYSCFHCNLNGPYICGAVEKSWVGVIWNTFRGDSHSVKYTEKKMRFI